MIFPTENEKGDAWHEYMRFVENGRSHAGEAVWGQKKTLTRKSRDAGFSCPYGYPEMVAFGVAMAHV